MARKVLFKSLAVLVTAFILSACGRGLGIAMAAPDLNLRDLNGNMVKLSDHKGKVIILDFFATWCPPCKQETPDFIELQKQYGDQGFVMIGVSLSRLEDTRRFAEEFGVNYTILLADNYAASVYGPLRAIPVTYVIGKDFKIARKYIGFRPKEVFENDVKELLNK